jgi:hypothetical protein
MIPAVTMVLLEGKSILDRLRCLSTQIREVVAHGVLHGAAGALTVAHLCLSHKMDLHKVAPGFPTAGEIPNDIDIQRLVAEFSNCRHC